MYVCTRGHVSKIFSEVEDSRTSPRGVIFTYLRRRDTKRVQTKMNFGHRPNQSPDKPHDEQSTKSPCVCGVIMREMIGNGGEKRPGNGREPLQECFTMCPQRATMTCLVSKRVVWYPAGPTSLGLILYLQSSASLSSRELSSAGRTLGRRTAHKHSSKREDISRFEALRSAEPERMRYSWGTLKVNAEGLDFHLCVLERK